MKQLISILFCCFSFVSHAQTEKPYIIILGVAQDGGYPHIGCTKQCCAKAWQNDSLKKYVVSFALVDEATNKWWLFEATPDIKEQLQLFKTITKNSFNYLPDGIFITHAHIGHYTGLMEFGREALNTKGVKVYALPKLRSYLETNGPWNQLVTLHNIDIVTLDTTQTIKLGSNITVSTFTVPHRDEYSETGGFRIAAADKKYLFIPDINKWGKWDKNIIQEVESVDIALLDGTFYNADELGKINITEVPHPMITETMQLFKGASTTTKEKIYFIHLNHTNPVLWDTATKQTILNAGYNLARQGQKI